MAQAALKHDYEGPVQGTMPMTSGHAGEHHIDDGRQIDLVHLARQTLGDVELEREVLSLFVVQSQVYLLRLQAAENAADWKRAAHTLKGSARGIGAWQLAEAAEAAEALGGEIHDAAHRNAVDMMLLKVCATNACVRQIFDEQAD